MNKCKLLVNSFVRAIAAENFLDIFPGQNDKETKTSKTRTNHLGNPKTRPFSFFAFLNEGSLLCLHVGRRKTFSLSEKKISSS